MQGDKMDKFLSADLMCKSFGRLSARDSGGKKHLERTSALLYFLAFDAACKHFKVKSLDFTPETFQGRNHRKQFELEFTRLVVLDNAPDNIKQVIELGKVDQSGKNPENRVSSNFFSVPVKKGANGDEGYVYPGRPKAPVLSMGKVFTKIPWGVARHNQWKSNLPELLSEAKSSTPNVDLALFAIRDVPIRSELGDIFSIIIESLKSKFTTELCEYFSGKFKEEKVFVTHIGNAFSDRHKTFVNDYMKKNPETNNYTSMRREDLIRRIVFLENLLQKNTTK